MHPLPVLDPSHIQAILYMYRCICTYVRSCNCEVIPTAMYIVCVSLCEIEQVANMTKDFDLIQRISDHEVMFANNYYFPHPIPSNLFSYVFLGHL